MQLDAAHGQVGQMDVQWTGSLLFVRMYHKLAKYSVTVEVAAMHGVHM